MKKLLKVLFFLLVEIYVQKLVSVIFISAKSATRSERSKALRALKV